MALSGLAAKTIAADAACCVAFAIGFLRAADARLSMLMRAARRAISCRVVRDLHQPTNLRQEKALVLFSGGQDSATCLAWALASFSSVETIGFAYGQRHRVELDCRAGFIERLRREFPDWSGKLGEDHLINLGV